MSDTAIRAGELELSEAGPGDYFALLKPRVVSLVVFTGVAGVIVAPGSIHPLIAVVALLCIAVGAGAAGAINMWYDRDIDTVMTRTQGRPIPTGKIAPGDALGFGVVLAVGSVAVMGLAVNFAAAGLLAVSILFYVFVYTIWLKRRTPQNIVIGGAAGAFPPMIGWAAVSGSVSVESLLLFALIFFWTPPHFWALALFINSDYSKAGIPMMPVVAGRQSTRHQIFGYSLILAAVAVAPFALGLAGAVYGVAAIVLSVIFCALSWQVGRSKTDRPEAMQAEKRLFKFSILYLFALFAAVVADRMILA